TVENLEGHKKKQVSFNPWTPDSTGTYTVLVYNYLPGDENPGNDVLMSKVIVINQGLDAAAFSVDFDTVLAQAPFTPKATFINKQVIVKPFLATMKITPGNYISADTVKDLAYNNQRQVSFAEWVPPSSGTYTVKIFTELLYDENKSNDTLTKSITVIKNIGIVDEMDIIPDVYSLSQNYPNPFNPTTVIRYGLPEAGQVELKIYDMLGREVETLVSDFRNAGMHEVKFNAAELSSGVYIYRIKSGSFVQTKKLMLIK
ncbi:MAG TPA: T9SS type A sorting domain-containing protein, partial [Ignavibacteriales bacterium]|nr:T9SS type A sorting domain-containing protein [Ignavibacteriales bacterium]